MSKQKLVVFDRSVKTSEMKGLFEEFEGNIIINGNLEIDDVGTKICCTNICAERVDAYSNSEVYIIGNLTTLNACCVNLNLNGNLHVLGDLDANSLEITGDVYVSGKMRVISLKNQGGIYASDVTLGR